MSRLLISVLKLTPGDSFRTYLPNAYKEHYRNTKTHRSSKMPSILPQGCSIFEKTCSRKRRPFTEEENRVLKVGYENHGTVRAAIVKDPIFQGRIVARWTSVTIFKMSSLNSIRLLGTSLATLSRCISKAVSSFLCVQQQMVSSPLPAATISGSPERSGHPGRASSVVAQ